MEEYIRSGRDKSIVDPDPSGHARSFLSEYDYTEGFTGKKKKKEKKNGLAHLSRTGIN